MKNSLKKVALLWVFLYSAPLFAATLLNGIAATVDGHVITRLDLKQEIAMVRQEFLSRGSNVAITANAKRQILERMITSQVVLNLAEKQGVSIARDKVQRVIEGMARRQNITVAELYQSLAKQDVSYDFLRAYVRNALTVQQVTSVNVPPQIKISQADRNRVRSQNQARELHLAYILIQTPEGLSAQDLEQKRAKAEGVRQKLLKGASFAQMAVEFSDDDKALKNRGDWGWRTVDRIPSTFIKALKAVRENGISQVIRSPNGFHILKLLGKRTVAKNAQKFAQVKVRHILFAVNDEKPQEDALELAQNIRSQIINKKVSFMAAAKKYSADSGEQGGQLGWVLPQSLVAPFRQAANTLPLQRLSQPVRTVYGYHLIEVLGRKKDFLPKELQEKRLEQVLYQKKYEEARATWLSRLRGQAFIFINKE